jgi:hypothetical protein
MFFRWCVIRARAVDPRRGFDLRRAVARRTGVVKKRHVERFYRSGCVIYLNNLKRCRHNPDRVVRGYAMRSTGMVAACVGLALLVGGCDPTRDSRYLREGIGTDLYWDGLPAATQLQDIYLANICAQAAKGIYAVSCDGLSLGPRDWGLLVQAGMNDIDLRCDAYLSWLYDRKSSKEPFLKELAALGGAAAGILKATDTGATPIALTAIAFGIAADTFTNIDLRLVNAVDYTTVNSVVRDNRTQFRFNNIDLVIDNRPAAIYVLRNYLSICVPDSIEMSINNTITVYHRAGPDALRVPPIALRAAPATSGTSASVRGAPVIRDATKPLPAVPKNPVVASATRLNNFEQSLTKREIEDFQEAVCVSPTGDLGPIDSDTRVAIQRALNSSDQLLTDRKGILLREKLRSGVKCSPH